MMLKNMMVKKLIRGPQVALLVAFSVHFSVYAAVDHTDPFGHESQGRSKNVAAVVIGEDGTPCVIPIGRNDRALERIENIGFSNCENSDTIHAVVALNNEEEGVQVAGVPLLPVLGAFAYNFARTCARTGISSLAVSIGVDVVTGQEGAGVILGIFAGLAAGATDWAGGERSIEKFQVQPRADDPDGVNRARRINDRNFVRAANGQAIGQLCAALPAAILFLTGN